ncbi:MAG: hypothetical protein CVU08_15895 [Bacteroidetes bacterium HGW-Bacteroidetes-3]|nr:MAG: hypothetical protein CVU08_15895 [Bacteroidetes bacterium HGW-Bacteroidetes-3]
MNILHKGCFFLLCLIYTIKISGQDNLLQNGYDSIRYDSLRIILEVMYDKDQNIRKLIYDSMETNPNENSKYVTQMISIDRDNLSVLIPILDTYGWIPQSEIGVKAGSALFYVIQHSNIELMNKYFPQLDSLSKIGEADRGQAAFMQDRLLMWKGFKQIYGTQATTSLRTDKSLVIWPIMEPDKVDSLRRSIGFELSVSENAKRLGAIYNPAEELPKK